MKCHFIAPILLSILSQLAYAQNVSPGLWKARTEISINDIPMPPISADDCLSSKESKNIRNYIQENLMPETSCKITKWDYKNPQLKASLSCKGNQGTSKGNLLGKVTEKFFTISGTLEGEHNIIGAVDIKVTYTGSYTKPCK